VIVAGILVRGVDLRWKLTLLRWSVFWHFLDVVWIAIFSFVFLGGLL
jgi:cytochrome o ubiquinol oxidase subunit 3